MAKFNPIGTQLGDLLSAANSDWSGTFGNESFSPNIINPPSERSTNNAPLNDTVQFPDYGESPSWSTGNQMNFSFDALGMSNLDRNQQFLQNEREATLAGQRGLQQQLTGAAALGDIASSNYAKKVQADLAAQQQLERSRQRPQGGFSASGATNLESGLSEAQAAGQIAIIKAQGEAQRRLARQQGNDALWLAAVNRPDLAAESFYTKSNALDATRNQERIMATTLPFQSQEAALDRASRERQAQLSAMGNIYGSMFGALSGPGANYRYWG